MKIYLAARYSAHPQMREVRDDLAKLGHEVTSRWIDMHDGKHATSFAVETLNEDPASCAKLGIHDVEDVQAADTVISFTAGSAGSKGGRHVEFGLALGLSKRLLVVGPREHIFHTLPQVEHHDTWVAALSSLREEADGG